MLFSDWNHRFQSLCSQSKMCRLGDMITSLRDPPIYNPKGRPSTTRLSGPSEGPAQPINHQVECSATAAFATSQDTIVQHVPNGFS